MTTKYEATNIVGSDENVQKRKAKTPAFIYVLTFLSTIGGFLFGYDTGVVSGAMILIRCSIFRILLPWATTEGAHYWKVQEWTTLFPFIMGDEFRLNTTWHEAIVSVTIAAAWMFALIGGWLTDKFGRKPVILLASLVFTAGSIIMGVATTKEILLVGRIVVGVGIGIASMSVPVYIAESALPEARGHLVTVNTLFITCGQFVAAAVCGFFSTHSEGWRYMLGLAALPAAIQFFGFLGMPESPRWLVSKKKYEDALKVLRSIRGENFPVEEELEMIKTACMQEEMDMEHNNKAIWLQVLQTPSTKRALVVGCVLQSVQQLGGINTVMYYSASIIQMAGVQDVSDVIWLSCATAGVNFFCTFIGLFLVERVGRRPLTLWSLTGTMVALIILGVGFHLMSIDTPLVTSFGNGTCGVAESCAACIDSSSNCGFCYYDTSAGIANGTCWAQDTGNPGSMPNIGPCSNVTAAHGDTGPVWAAGWCPSNYSWITVTALGLYLLFFAPGMGPMPWTINSEIYPMWARSFCSSVATSTNWMFNLLVSMTFLSLTEWLTKEGAFYLYAVLAFVGLVMLFLILPETKGKSLEEMECLFADRLFTRLQSSSSKSVQMKLNRPPSTVGTESGADVQKLED